MNTPAHRLSMYSAVMLIAIGLAQLLDIGPRFLPPSWVVIFRYVPYGEWLYPSGYVVAGVIAALGVLQTAALQMGFRLCAVLFLIWGLAGIPAWLMGLGGNMQGTAANLLLAYAMWTLAYYVSLGARNDRINKQVVRLAEQVDQERGVDV